MKYRFRSGIAMLAMTAAAAVAGAQPTAVRADTSDLRVDGLLAQSRAALGGTALDRRTVLRLDGRVTQGGLSGTGTRWLEIGGSRFAESYATPPVEGGDGFDGSVAWNRDGSGLVWVDGGAAGRAQAISGTFVGNDALWSANRGGATVSWGGTKSAKGTDYDSLVVSAPGADLPFELWFDRVTHLPVRLTQSVGPLSAATTYSGYRRFAGIMVPYTLHTQTSDGNTWDAAITSVAVDPPDAQTQLAKPDSNVHDFSIAGGATQTEIPFDLVENHVYLDVTLNGKGPYRFVFDTGGANIVDPQVAQEIGASGKGSVQGGGVGAATESVSFAKVATMSIGAATIENPLFAVAPVRRGFGIAGGRPIDGIIGFEVLSRFVTAFDYAKRVVVLALPGTMRVPAGAGVVPFVFDGQQPQFACAIDDVAAQCTLDTGARDSITLLGPFVAAHPQVTPPTLTAKTVTGFGFGGPAFGRLGRLRSVGIGPFVVPQVVADFSSQTQGAFAMPFVAANVGGNLLKRFDLVLDYGASRMMLTPNALFRQPDFYERAGLFIVNREGAKVVYDVRPDSPAAAAGIVKGDVIATLNGTEAASRSLDDVRNAFLAKPGTIVRLGLTAPDGAAKSVRIRLADGV